MSHHICKVMAGLSNTELTFLIQVGMYLKHLSDRSDQIEMCKVELVEISACSSDEYDYS